MFGNEEEILTELEAEGHTINTAYIERNNLTIRNGVSRVIRKTINYSKKVEMLSAHIFFFFARVNFVKTHEALKIEVNEDKRRWKQRTPAMAANITDHRWSIKELCNFKPPPI